MECRLLGLGNGGAAGHINPQSLAWPAQAAMPWRRPTWAPRRTPTRAWAIASVARLWLPRDASHDAGGEAAVQAYYGRGPSFRTSMAARRRPAGDAGAHVSGGLTTASWRISPRIAARRCMRTSWNDQIFAKCPFTQEQEAAVIAAANEYMAAREVPVAAEVCL